MRTWRPSSGTSNPNCRGYPSAADAPRAPCPDRLFLCGLLALFEGCPDLARLEIEDLAIRGTAVTALRCAIEPGTEVGIQIQTNGVRLDEGFLDLFKRLRVWPPRRSRQIHPSPVSKHPDRRMLTPRSAAPARPRRIRRQLPVGKR